MEDVAQLKERMKEFWALGDYPQVAKRFEDAADTLVAACRIGPGDRVLDVAAGNGNVAVAAARTGAQVTASDFAPTLIAAGRQRTESLGLDIAWDEADAESLPYETGRFDAVTSAFGLMFAPQPDVAAAEAFRVVRPGGIVGLTAWTPDGFTGQVTELLGAYLPVPLGTPHPIDWGIEATVRRRLVAHSDTLEISRSSVIWEFPSVTATLAWQEQNFGALVAAQRTLGERYEELCEQLTGLIVDWNRATDGSVRIPAAYLLVVARKR